jgi:hypothetical protein
MTQDQPLRRLTEEEKVLRAFVRDGRLVSIPAKPKKRALLLPFILERCFPDDRDYEEKEVNQRLALLYRDVAALRRYLVDASLMTREAGIYRRTTPPGASGGSPEASSTETRTESDDGGSSENGATPGG